ncbi:MAG: type II toxin-antitoxin system VapC family toxin [Pseudomonadota bacterium]
MQTIVLDANIAVKILHDEHDSRIAQQFLTACADKKSRILVPEHFLYELVNVSKRLGVDTENVLRLFDAMMGSILTVARPERSTWLLAEKIADDGHEKSGFPTMYDSIYHALAIESEAVFVTADKRHYVKSGHHSNISLLENWESLL